MAESTCVVDGCGGKPVGQGRCRPCYYRYRDSPEFVYVQDPSRSERERFESFVVRPTDPDACWLWTGSITAMGYAQFQSQTAFVAHRWSYEQEHGPVPDGLVLDHVCHNRDLTCAGGSTCPHRACTNPRHLEPVTDAENLQRSTLTHGNETECPAGHPYDEANTYWDSKGHRRCRTCNAAAHHKRKGTLAPDDPRHGTRQGYAGFSCRCVPCVTAGRAYEQARRDARRNGAA